MTTISSEAIFRDLPVLETQRLLLRPLTLDDAEDMFEYASDPEVARYTTWYPHTSLDESRAVLESIVQRYKSAGVVPWGVVHRRDDRLIGTCGFGLWEHRHSRAEIAYAIGRKYWGQGLSTEAVREVIAFGFRTMMLNRIEARCLPQNISSIRVMEKSGMSFEGVLREHMLLKGRFADLKLYAILRREWSGGANPL